jgi:prepilin-type N-terminal cleavage/methylation domain-containing protein
LKPRLASAGFSFVEIMVAVALLALCAAPAAYAIRNGIDATTVAAAKANELRCLRNLMESVLAEPYQNLADQVKGMQTRSTYSRPKDATCIERNVYIAMYEHEYGKAPVVVEKDKASTAQLESSLLYITVSSPESGYSFTTLVAR